MASLGLDLWHRFDRTGSLADLNEAIAVSHRALAVTPEDRPDRAGKLTVVGVALQARFRRSGEATDLDEGIAVSRQAVAATPGDHPSRTGRLTNYGLQLWIRFEHSGSLTDLDEAIKAGRQGADVNAAAPFERVAAAILTCPGCCHSCPCTPRATTMTIPLPGRQ